MHPSRKTFSKSRMREKRPGAAGGSGEQGAEEKKEEGGREVNWVK